MGILDTPVSQKNAGPFAIGVRQSPNFAKYRRALAKVRTGAADGRILCLGDSTTYGFGSGTSSTPLSSYASMLAGLLNSYHAPATVGLGVPPSTINGNATVDSRWAVGAGWTLDQQAWARNSCFKGASGSGNLIYTPGAQSGLCDTFDVYYVANAISATFTVTATGGATVTVNTGTQNGVFKTTCTAAAAATTNAVTIVNTGSNAVRIVGIEPRSSTNKRLLVGNAGVSSAGTTDWAAAGPYINAAAIAAYAPDLTIISLGLNDAAGGTPTTPAVLKANLQAVITAALGTGDVLLMTFEPPRLGQAIAPAGLYIPMYKELTASNPVGLIDIYGRWGDITTMNNLGYYYDTLHPSMQGYMDIAQAAFEAIRSI